MSIFLWLFVSGIALTSNLSMDDTEFKDCEYPNESEKDISCRCVGENITNVPQNLKESITHLRLENCGIQNISKNDFARYKLIREIDIHKCKDLRYIEAETFNNLLFLNTISIQESPKLLFLEEVFGYLPKIKKIRVRFTGLQEVPSFRNYSIDGIINEIDLENNKIKKIKSNAVHVQAGYLRLNRNEIEEIEDYSFNSSEIGTLILKSNPLWRLSTKCFVGIKHMRMLDLSETRITNLPASGLQNLETLIITGTKTLKKFPSIFQFNKILKASLTYNYHCCAFMFPQKGDPLEYIKHEQFIAEQKRIYCSDSFTTETPHINSGFYGFGDRIYHLFKRSPDGFGTIPPETKNTTSYPIINPNGVWHMTTITGVTGTNRAFCGNLSKNYETVECTPIPDAFNPCEDVMGNEALRTAVWFVVFAAVLGNMIVIIVLLSSRFKMTVSKFLMCNLAFADFCMGLYLLIIAVIDLHTIGEYFNYAIDWQEGPGCVAAGFLTVYASELSIFTLTVITLERWYAITYAIHLNKRLKLKMAAKIMFIGWLFALTMATLPVVGISGYTITSICLPMEHNSGMDRGYLMSILLINGLAFMLICACYVKMYCSIHGHNSTASASDTTVAKRMALLVFTDFACWAPIAFFGLTAAAGHPLINVTHSKFLLVFFFPLNSMANPFLYAILTKQFRRDLFLLLSKYGFCTNRALKYKGNFSKNHNFRSTQNTPVRHLSDGSILTQFTSMDCSKGSKVSLSREEACQEISQNPAQVTIKMYEVNGRSAELTCNTNSSDKFKDSRKLSIVIENQVNDDGEKEEMESSVCFLSHQKGYSRMCEKDSPVHSASFSAQTSLLHDCITLESNLPRPDSIGGSDSELLANEEYYLRK